MPRMDIADLHLDLAWNATNGRDLSLPPDEQPDLGFGPAAVSLPTLLAGGTRLIGATLFADPDASASPAQQCRAQLAAYHEMPLVLVKKMQDLGSADLAAVVLMEGADAIDLDEDELSPRAWFEAGVRIVGLAWGQTRYAGGTRAPGPLTPDGRRLVPMLDELGMIHDASHLAEESLDGLLDLATGPVFASHSNCQILVKDDPNGRHLTDRHIADITGRGGIVGINLFDKFLLPPTILARRRATLADWTAHVRHVCDLAGDARHVALGSDADGGFGKLRLPEELDTVADYPKLGDALSAAGFGDDDIGRILYTNAHAFLEKSLRATS